ncbi:cell division protein FtsL [Labrys neptuniae]
MTRIFNLILVGLLVASAIGVYSIKYESTLQAEKVAKLRRSIETERRAIEALRAEWAYMSQPDRIGALARRHLDLTPMKINQSVDPADLPDKAREGDLIAEKLEGLGLAGAPQVTGSTP